MATVLIAPPPLQEFIQGGTPVSGGLLFTYASGTTTKQSTYRDFTGATQNTNPITLDVNGQCDLWLISGDTYTFVLSPSTDTDPPANPYWTRNGITGIANSVTGSSGGVATGTLIQTGDVKWFAGPGGNLAAGWLLCNGAAVSRTTYATLYAAISTTWGVGDASSTFNLPDLRGRVPAGADNMGGSFAGRVTSASIGGSAPAVLGVGAGTELSQTDTITITTTDPGHSHNITTTGAGLRNAGTDLVVFAGNTATSNTATTGITVTATSGLLGTQQNIQPTVFGNWAIWSGSPLLNQAGGTVTAVTAGTGLLVGTSAAATITTSGTLNVAPATSTSLGGILVGSGLSITATGILSSMGASSTITSLTSGGAGITLTPATITTGAGIINLIPATATSLGGVIAGANVNINAGGTISVTTGTGSGGGTVTSVSTGAFLTGGPIVAAGTISFVTPLTITGGGTNATTVTAARVNINQGIVTITPAGGSNTMTPNFANSNVVQAAITTTSVLANPSGMTAGATYQVIINMATATPTVSYGSAYKFNPPYSNASPPATGAGDNVLSIVTKDGSTALAILAAGTFS